MSKTATREGLSWYLEHIKSTPLLTAEEERQLARRIHEHSDPIAREQMINANLRLVVSIAKGYSKAGTSLNDLVAEGNLGLMRAVEEFNPDAGVRFSTYAAWWIKQSIRRVMINAGQPIHIPAYLMKLISKWRRASRELEGELGRPATSKEMSNRLGVGLKKVEIIRQGLAAVNSPNQMGSDETQVMSEMFPAEDEQLPEDGMMKASDAPIVKALLSSLDERERKILELRFGLDGHDGPQRTFKEIGEAVSLTRERVRQLEKKALAGLKQIVDEML